MGAKCSCFDGAHKVILQPENQGGDATANRRRFPSNGASPDQVLSSRARAGSYQTGAQTRTPAGQMWASPVPHAMGSRISLEGFQAETGSVSLDYDGHNRRPDAVSHALRPKNRSMFEAEQLLRSPGTLPPPMSADERERVVRKLLPTATYDMLAQIPPELTEAEGEDGQNLRRRLARGSTLVFFTAGYPGKRFVFERAFELGIKTVVIEHPDSWARGLLDEGLIAKFLPVDMNQSAEDILRQSLELIKGLGADGITGEADGVFSVVELSMPLVARICEALGLPSPAPSSVDAARDKYRTRAALKAAGLPTPRNCLIHTEADIPKAAKHVGFPAVLKPISGAASLGVKKVVEEKDLVTCYREVVNELQALVVVSGALQQGDGSQGVAADKVVDMTVLFEQYLDGHEVDVDVVLSEGQWRYAGVTDNGPTLEPYFNETWGVCPSLLSLSNQRELKELAVKSCFALGFASGVFHVECKYTSTGPQLIEVNARMGGGPVHEMNIRTWGVDLVEEAIFIALGIPSRPFVPKAPLVCSAYYVVPIQNSGVVTAVPDYAKVAAETPDVIWAKPMVKVGDKVVGPADGFPTWVADLLVQKPTAIEARDFVWKLWDENQVKIRLT